MLAFFSPFRTNLVAFCGWQLGLSVSSTAIFVVSVWNGASYYVEVFGRRFEKDLIALRRELDLMQSTESAVAHATAHVTHNPSHSNSQPPTEAAAAATGLSQPQPQPINVEETNKNK